MKVLASPNVQVSPPVPVQAYLMNRIGSAEDAVLRGTLTPRQCWSASTRRCRGNSGFRTRPPPRRSGDARHRAGEHVVREHPWHTRLAIHGVLLVLAVPFCMPLAWMVGTSLKTKEQVYPRMVDTSVVSFVKQWWPSPVHWRNYPEALAYVPFPLYLRNTLTLCVLNVVGAVGRARWRPMPSRNSSGGGGRCCSRSSSRRSSCRARCG